ncbi:hypothetical protein HZC07_04570 [Candidatus Micrarchaeota archaeon]|nr:hypothetical protein [Candidatus Micrarchaeota archaeon]
MHRLIFILLIVGIVAAVPSCPYYLYKDYVDAGAYHFPDKPQDTLLQYCSFSLDEICLLTNLLNESEKTVFIAESIANNSFGSIKQWNENLVFTKYPPNGSKSSVNIRDAWINIVYLSPSVYDNGTYLINNSSNATIKHGFSFVVNKVKLSGDCKSNYRICGYDYSVNTIQTNESINTSIFIKSEYLIDRYHLVKHCSKWSCWYTCDYYRTDSFKDSLTTSDSKKIKIENFSSQSNYSVTDYYNGLAEILINLNDSNVLFQIGKSTFYKSNYSYRTRYENPPYNVLVKEIIWNNRTVLNGLSIINQSNFTYTLLAPYYENCSLTAFGHFTSETLKICNMPNTTKSKPVFKTEEPIIIKHFLEIFGLLLVAYILYKIGRGILHA